MLHDQEMGSEAAPNSNSGPSRKTVATVHTRRTFMPRGCVAEIVSRSRPSPENNLVCRYWSMFFRSICQAVSVQSLHDAP